MREQGGAGTDLREVHRAVAEEHDAILVDARVEFERLMVGRKPSDYFVADGHCNDAGYVELTRIIAAALASADSPR